MLTYPNIDPVALELGALKIHWYGIMYLVSFLAGWFLGSYRTRDAFRGWARRDLDDVLFYIALGVILGGRIGYVLFYAPGQFAQNPVMLLQVWQGGMSFHGGLLGTMLAMWLFARRRPGWSFFKVADFVAPLIPLGLGAGRIGNFINGNLWGKPSELPWAMVFPSAAAGDVPRHPSQLYEALLEGAALFVIVWLFSRRLRPLGAVSGVFLLGYGVFRFLVEFVRVPDAHIGYLAFEWMTMGHLLTLPMILGGGALLWWAYRPVESRLETAPGAGDGRDGARSGPAFRTPGTPSAKHKPTGPSGRKRGSRRPAKGKRK